MNEIEIRIKTIVDQAIADLNKTGDAIQNLGRTSRVTADPVGKAGLSLGDLAKYATVATAAIYATKKVYDATIGATLDYAKEVKDLSRLIGASSEESSKLIQVAGDVEITYGTLSSALEAAIRNGIKPNIEGISELSDQYLAIKDPVERAAFAMKLFGRNGAEMMPFLEMGPERIKAAGIEAEKLGTILDDNAIAATAKFKDQLDILKNQFEGLVTTIGLYAIPILSSFITLLGTANARVMEHGGGTIEGFLNITSIPQPKTGILFDWLNKTNPVKTSTSSYRPNNPNDPDFTGYASGGSGVVPAGFEDDSYLIGLSSRERFSVTPANKEDPLLKSMQKIEKLLASQKSDREGGSVIVTMPVYLDSEKIYEGQKMASRRHGTSLVSGSMV